MISKKLYSLITPLLLIILTTTMKISQLADLIYSLILALAITAVILVVNATSRCVVLDKLINFIINFKYLTLVTYTVTGIAVITYIARIILL